LGTKYCIFNKRKTFIIMKNLSNYKLLSVLLLFVFMAASLYAQDDKSKRPSPPATAEATIGKTKVTINYSQPAVKGRDVWGSLVPFGKVWRTGANEATTFEVNTDVKIEGKDLKAGKYSLFSIPGEKEWTFIFNTVPEQWGSFNYDSSKDALRVTATPTKGTESTERMTFNVESSGMVSLKWEKLMVGFKVTGQ
jgi:hypothetical protein